MLTLIFRTIQLRNSYLSYSFFLGLFFFCNCPPSRIYWFVKSLRIVHFERSIGRAELRNFKGARQYTITILLAWTRSLSHAPGGSSMRTAAASEALWMSAVFVQQAAGESEDLDGKSWASPGITLTHLSSSALYIHTFIFCDRVIINYKNTELPVYSNFHTTRPLSNL